MLVVMVRVGVVILLHPRSTVRGLPSLVEVAVTNPGVMTRAMIPWKVHHLPDSIRGGTVIIRPANSGRGRGAYGERGRGSRGARGQSAESGSSLFAARAAKKPQLMKQNLSDPENEVWEIASESSNKLDLHDKD